MGRYKGWIKLDRSLFYDDLWTSECPASYKVLWINLLIMANHKDSSVYERQVKRGQLWTSQRKLAELCHISKNDIRKVLNMFVEDGKIHVDFQRQGILITIRNYAKYQDGVSPVKDTEGDTKRDTNRDTEGDTKREHKRIYKECNKNDKEKERRVTFPVRVIEDI